MDGISATEDKRHKLREERLRNEALTARDVLDFVKQGKITEARHNLIFHTDPTLFSEKIDALVGLMKQDFDKLREETRRHFFVFLTKLTLDLVSFLPHWNLKNKELHRGRVLADAVIDTRVRRNKEILHYWSTQDQALAEALLKEWTTENMGRFKVEGINDEREAEDLAAKLVGDSVTEYINNMEDCFERSNLRRIGELRVFGQTETEIGNDHTTNLEYAMWLGASFVTTNPQLVEITWELNPELWSSRVDEIVRSQYSVEDLSRLIDGGSKEQFEKVVEEINTDVTMEVVFENAKLLRGVFLLNDGEKGLVCLQVNPLRHSDADAMIKEALYVYSKLTERFGGVPNIVFKLPATKAGLKAAKELTSKGIGVTITVSFGLFQSLPFADVISKGNAIVSYLVVMNGRLADPIISELKKLGGNLAQAGRWAGVAVAKRLYPKLYAPIDRGGRGYDSRRMRIIVASLRNYEGSFPDITELIGVPIITVFPNIRRAFDSEEKEIDPQAIKKPPDQFILEGLLNSELFRQACYIPEEDNDDVKPRSPFLLEDEEKVLEYLPVKNTLGQFCEYRIKMGELVKHHISTMHLNRLT